MKKKNQNLVTWKIKYYCEQDFSNYIYDYNKVLRFTYNRLFENSELSTKELTESQKSMQNKPDSINSHLMNSAIFDARGLVERFNEPIIFGGKDNFIKRCQHKIDRETFQRTRLVPLSSVGESVKFGNRLFTIQNNSQILFKPDRQNHFMLDLIDVGRNRKQDFEKLIKLQNSKNIAITYKLDLDYIYITFDYDKIKHCFYKVRQNRVMSIDMNPNSIGWSVVDWQDGDNANLVASGIFSLKPLNDLQGSISVSSGSDKSKYFTNKRKHEIIEISKQLFELCKHYKCEIFAIEDLNIRHNDLHKGNKTNRLVQNQWCRNLLANQIRKRIKSSSTTLAEVQPQYSSFIGNLVFRHLQLPDEILASIEIGRRGFEFCTQYIFKRRPHQKTVVFPQMETVKNQLSISLAEIGVDVPEFVDWKNLYSLVKKSKVKYRFSLLDAIQGHSKSLFSKNHKQKYLQTYIFV